MHGNSIWDDIRWQLRFGSSLIRLIIINIIVFIVINLLHLFAYIFQKEIGFDITEFLSLYAAPERFVTHPWGILTYMFVHESFWHILWNVLGLYWFGQIVQDTIGKSKIIPIYLMGGIAGGLLYMLAFNTLPVFSTLTSTAFCFGASAAVMAIVLSAATIAPNYELLLFLIGPVKIKWIALAYIILDLINIQHGNPGGHIAHLGGALFGFIYIRQLQRGTDLGKIYYLLSDFFSSLLQKKDKLRVAYKKKTASANTKKSTEALKKGANEQQQERLNAILDKINRSSYDSLSKEEKEFLFKMSQE